MAAKRKTSRQSPSPAAPAAPSSAGPSSAGPSSAGPSSATSSRAAAAGAARAGAAPSHSKPITSKPITSKPITSKPGAARELAGERVANDSGLSLDQLSVAFAEMLGAGADPYTSPPAPDDDDPLPIEAAAADDVSSPVTADDPCEVTPRSIIEALLFVGSPAGEGISSAQLAGLMRGVRPAEVDAILRELNDSYAARGAPYAIVDIAGGYRLALKPEHNRLRDKFYGRIRRARLSQSAIEVLSLVAYNAPLSAAEINRLRGADSGPILSQLVRRELLRLDRTPEAKRGVYSTTPRFLSVFGLESLADLPKSIDPPA